MECSGPESFCADPPAPGFMKSDIQKSLCFILLRKKILKSMSIFTFHPHLYTIYSINHFLEISQWCGIAQRTFPVNFSGKFPGKVFNSYGKLLIRPRNVFSFPLLGAHPPFFRKSFASLSCLQKGGQHLFSPSFLHHSFR